MPRDRGVPDQRLSLSPATTFSRLTSKIVLGIAGPAIALAGIPAGLPAAVPARGTGGLAFVTHVTVTHVAQSMARPSGAARRSRTLEFSVGATAAGTRSAGTAAHPVHAGQDTGGPRRIAQFYLAGRFHWQHWQFRYLRRLWEHESGWNRYAANPYSGAYGIPQALPGAKMASAGPDWRAGSPHPDPGGEDLHRDKERNPVRGVWSCIHRDCERPPAGGGRRGRVAAGICARPRLPPRGGGVCSRRCGRGSRRARGSVIEVYVLLIGTNTPVVL